MFRPRTPDDITKEEWRKYIKPHYDLVEEYIKRYIIPDYCAFFIVSGYRYCSEEDSLECYINSALVFFNVDTEQMKRLTMKKKIIEILKINYGLIVVNEDPLQVIEVSPED